MHAWGTLAYRPLGHPAGTSDEHLRWLTALATTLPWVRALTERRGPGGYYLRSEALTALVAYVHPECHDRDQVLRVMTRSDLHSHLMLRLRDAGHRVDTHLRSDPTQRLSAIADPIERAWHVVRSTEVREDPIARAADWLLGCAHHTMGEASAPVVGPVDVAEARGATPRLGPPAVLGVQTSRPPQSPEWGGDPLIEIENAAEHGIVHTLVTRRPRSWLWLVCAAAAYLPDGGTVTGPGPGGTVRVVIRRTPLVDPPFALTRPRWAFVAVQPDHGVPHHPLLWGAALHHWPVQHALNALEAGDRERAAQQRAEPWSSLEPSVLLHTPEGAHNRARVWVPDELPPS